MGFGLCGFKSHPRHQVAPRIVVDVMGADRPPGELAAGAAQAAAKLPLDLVVVGDARQIEPHLPDLPNVSLLHCPLFVDPEEKPVEAARRTDTSLARGLALLAQGQADAFLSPGNTGAVVATALLQLGRLPGVHRPALCASLPTLKGKEVLLVDAGASADYKPPYLLQFASMGAAYARVVLDLALPTVGLLNIGTEPHKGDTLTQQAHALLAERPDFRGNVEPHTVLTERPVDVVVTGGFSGNLFLKALEGGVEAVTEALRRELHRSLRARLGGWIARPALRAVARGLGYREHNAAPLLGVRGLVFVAHGRSDAPAVAGAVRRVFKVCQADFLAQLPPF